MINLKVLNRDITAKTFYILTTVSLLLAFLLLYPKVASHTPFIRNLQLNKFISEIEKTQSVDGRKYWMFREFYSPGSFEFNRTGFNQIKSLNQLQAMGIHFDEVQAKSFLIFSSSKLKSEDFL